MLTFENSFLAQAEWAILVDTSDRISSQDDSFLLKILSFLSFHIDQIIEKGMIFHKISPTKGDPLQASIGSPGDIGVH